MRIEELYREEAGRLLATLIRQLGSFDDAEEVVHEVFAAALAQWPEGVPDNPRAWLFRAAKNKAVDLVRRSSRQREKQRELAAEPGDEEAAPPEGPEEALPDDRLQLIFTCCHPALPLEAQVALTLHTLCGLSTEEIARAFLVPVPTLAQRLVRAKAKIRDAAIPYRVPPPELLPERLEAVMVAVYLVFSEGYAASSGAVLVRSELCAEAIRLGRLLAELMPERPECRGLLALMLLHDARSPSRVGPAGELVLLEEQDRSRWHQGQIREGAALVEAALRQGPPGPYTLQAAIAALHASAPRAEDTDWRQIAGLYALLLRVHPSPVVELNYGVAVAMADGPERGLRILDGLTGRPELRAYHLLPAARADLLRRLDRRDEAAAAYRAALLLVDNEPERGFLRRRLADLEGAPAEP